MSFLSGIVDVLNAAGKSIVARSSAGRIQPIVLRASDGIAVSSRDLKDGTSEVAISATGTAGESLAPIVFSGGGQPEREPTHVHINANLSATYAEAENGTIRRFFINANQQALRHAPVDCVLLVSPTVNPDGTMQVPSSSEISDGFALEAGSRVLLPYGALHGIWMHDGVRLVRTDTEITMTNGDSVFVRSGRFYKNRTMFLRTTATFLEPVWGNLEAPWFARYARVVAGGSNATMCPFFVDITLGVTTLIRVEARSVNETAGTPPRFFDVSAVLHGNGTIAEVVDGELSFAEPGETQAEARLRFDFDGEYATIVGLASVAGGDTYNYSVAVYLNRLD